MKHLLLTILLFLQFLLPSYAATKTAKSKEDFEINTPLKALALYFPPSSVLRCLNHSDIPRKPRKAFIYRNIKIPDAPQIEQKVSIGANTLNVSGKRLVFNAHELRNGIMYPIKINWEQAFGLGKNGELKSVGFFGLEDILGLQKKIHIKDKIGSQDLNYETFLKTTKGKIGNLNYSLNLHGQDKAYAGKVRYVLVGDGKLGKDKIAVAAVELDKDLYEISERYGNIEIVTSVKVFD